MQKNKFCEGEVDVWKRNKVKGRFHGPTEIYKINRRCIQISRQVLQTSRHRRVDIGANLADD